jgi:hypothetical protein
VIAVDPICNVSDPVYVARDRKDTASHAWASRPREINA